MVGRLASFLEHNSELRIKWVVTSLWVMVIIWSINEGNGLKRKSQVKRNKIGDKVLDSTTIRLRWWKTQKAIIGWLREKKASRE